ncbi:hypothetical protein Ct9H90mP29_16400 [bacterium]|nr:MAG: hypothetical protein Ct9H90mP29_16400 [bacterium]
MNWIPDGYPPEGNLILFNNFYGGWESLPVNDWQSAVYELVTPNNNEKYVSMIMELLIPVNQYGYLQMIIFLLFSQVS